MASLGYFKKGPKVIPNEGNNSGGDSSIIFLGTDPVEIPSYNTLKEYFDAGQEVVINITLEEDNIYYYWRAVLDYLKYNMPDSEYIAFFRFYNQGVQEQVFYTNDPDALMELD